MAQNLQELKKQGDFNFLKGGDKDLKRYQFMQQRERDKGYEGGFYE